MRDWVVWRWLFWQLEIKGLAGLSGVIAIGTEETRIRRRELESYHCVENMLDNGFRCEKKGDGGEMGFGYCKMSTLFLSLDSDLQVEEATIQ